MTILFYINLSITLQGGGWHHRWPYNNYFSSCPVFSYPSWSCKVYPYPFCNIVIPPFSPLYIFVCVLWMCSVESSLMKLRALRRGKTTLVTVSWPSSEDQHALQNHSAKLPTGFVAIVKNVQYPSVASHLKCLFSLLYLCCQGPRCTGWQKYGHDTGVYQFHPWSKRYIVISQKLLLLGKICNGSCNYWEPPVLSRHTRKLF